jgi:hypothetical protein
MPNISATKIELYHETERSRLALVFYGTYWTDHQAAIQRLLLGLAVAVLVLMSPLLHTSAPALFVTKRLDTI